MPRPLPHPPPNLLPSLRLHIPRILLHRNTLVKHPAPQSVVTVRDRYPLAHHARPEMLAAVGAQLTFGAGGELEDGEGAKAEGDLGVLGVVDAGGVGTAGYDAQAVLLDLGWWV